MNISQAIDRRSGRWSWAVIVLGFVARLAVAVPLRTGRLEDPAHYLVLAGSAGAGGGALGGVALGLSALCRPSTLPASALIAAAATTMGPGSLAERFGRGTLVAGLAVAVLMPWAIRNAAIFGEPVWTTTHGGYTLVL